MTELNQEALAFHFKPDMVDFMMQIRLNNSRAFMDANRAEYIQKLRTPYYTFIEALTPTALAIDPQMEVRPSRVLSRIFRDTRFSRDKSPYRDHHWLAFRHQGEPREKAVMLWFEIRVEWVSWGLGFWGHNRPAMDILRRRMLANPDELLSISQMLNKHDFALGGDSFKRLAIPKELNQQLLPWYTRKELLIMRQNIRPQWVFEPGIAKRLSDDFLLLKPVYQLLRGCYELSL
ncbi:MAG: DUF2461 domain-containing protein [Clostridiales bacterium]|nr:DUF2461 domain-containing protein [Clostridiales bacterium]